MRIERKRYWCEGDQWYRETSYWHEDTQNCSTAFVDKVAEEDVPAEHRGDVQTSAPESSNDAPTAPAAPEQQPVAPEASAPAVAPAKVKRASKKKTETP